MNLVTGATGIVGVRLVFDLLKSGQVVKALKRPNSDMAFAEKVLRFYGADDAMLSHVEWVDGDLLDIFSIEDSLEGVETVYHTAALVSYRTKDKKNLFRTNEEGTKNLVNSCLTHDVKHLCHVSSVSA
jgi:nucleoside-diphosphate-sugar epimerase